MVICRETKLKMYRLVYPKEDGENEQIYFSSENKNEMFRGFGCDGFRCPAISPKSGDVRSQISWAIWHDVVVEVGRDGAIQGRTREEKIKIMEKSFEEEI